MECFISIYFSDNVSIFVQPLILFATAFLPFTGYRCWLFVCCVCFQYGWYNGVYLELTENVSVFGPAIDSFYNSCYTQLLSPQSVGVGSQVHGKTRTFKYNTTQGYWYINVETHINPVWCVCCVPCSSSMIVLLLIRMDGVYIQ